MVIKALINAWRSRGAMHYMYDELVEMLTATEGMFTTVGQVLYEGRNPSEVQHELYDTDVRVNKTERKIRRQIVEHLSIRPGGDVPACLVLMSLIKDAERIGDYCKNLFEIRSKLMTDESFKHLDSEIREIHTQVLETFAKTKKALKEGNEEIALQVTQKAKEIAHALDAKVAEVAASDLPVRVAVCRALALRHTKRVHCHLCNILSSLVQPVHKLDYFDSGPLRPDK